MRIRGNAKGQAVLSLDPEEGPLDDLETTCLLNALRSARTTGVLTLTEQVAIWLCVAFGPNPLQIALMRIDDILVLNCREDGQKYVEAAIPRMKKRLDDIRRDFRQRRLTPKIADIVLELVEENRQRAQRLFAETGYAIPLLMRENPSRLQGGPRHEYALHMNPGEVTPLVANAVRKLNVISHRTGKPLRVTTRRLRYTYATRLVREGYGMREVADLLDHSDLQHVRVYFDIKSDIVKSIDSALALALGPVAQAFLGKIVKGAADAERGADKASEIAILDEAEDAIRPVGTCGSYAFCGLMAPVACYTCASFQPWTEAPHHLLLEKLLANRERKIAAGRDGRMITIYDATILAIGDVITRIEAKRSAAA
jgi:hypothetical protein